MLLPYLLVAVVVQLVHPPTAAQLAAADPIVCSLRALGGPWLLPAIAACICVGWLVRRPPDLRTLKHALLLAGLGALVATLALLILRATCGSSLPSFIPAEESARPGLGLGLQAGVVEEAVFRLLVLPAAYGLLVGRMDRRLATGLSALVTGLAFAAAHEVGPGAGAFRADYFATRTIVPGTGFSVVSLLLAPALVIGIHGTAHLVIPLLFS